MNKAPLFAEVILPLNLKGTFTYAVPENLSTQTIPGMRVMVQLGKNKIYSGIIHEVHENAPESFEPKTILSYPDDKPLVNKVQLQFWDWIAKYYMCTIGEVMNAALPSGLKLASESVFHCNPSFENVGILNAQEREMLRILEEERSFSLDDVIKGTFGYPGIRIVRNLVDKGAAVSGQHIKGGYKPKSIACIGLHPSYEKEDTYAELLDSLHRAPAQVKALEEFARLSGRFELSDEKKEVERPVLVKAGIPEHAINGLIKKGIFRKYEKQVSRIHQSEPPVTRELNLLTPHQEAAYEEIIKALGKHPATLMEGVTSSGKTEVYIRLIKDQLDRGKQVLYLLPEIALTTQIIHRLKQVFGDKVGVFHSKYSDNERVEVYRNLAGLTDREPYSIILGVRSAVFLPLSKLGLIIVDEEHEHTYKQVDPAPRYHARDAVTILALYTGAGVIMGSATPSFESLYNAQQGKYGHVLLNERFGKVAMPEIIIADIRKARKRKQMKSHFTPELVNALQKTISEGKQAILFQNRRGFSNYVICDDCAYILKCGSCDVSLTYHKYSNDMVCHYCGYKTSLPQKCPECQSPQFHLKGFGTEKIEDDLQTIFPDVVIGRIDLDKARSRKAYEKIFGDFESGKMQILVGTQLVTKGLDFSNVNLVGILDADAMLHFPDFRAFEKSYQLMVQVSGRAGRRDGRGKVVIQTNDPAHPVIRSVIEQSPGQFFNDLIGERKLFKYPPVARMIKITLRHEIPSILDGGAIFLTNELKEIFGGRVLGPQAPVVGRTHGKYIKQIILKIEREASVEKAKGIIGSLVEIFKSNPVYKQIRLIVDVDPL